MLDHPPAADVLCSCGRPIDPDRAEFLTESGRPLVCQNCSTEGAKLVLMEYGHKTAGAAVVIPDDPEQKRRALRAFHRSR